MSIEETLLRQRQEAEALRLKEIEEAEEAERLRVEQKEAERGKAIHAQIDDLKSKKTSTDDDLKVLKDSYAGAVEAFKPLKASRTKINKVFNEFKPELAKKGIKSRVKLTQSDEFKDEKESVEYKDARKEFGDKVGLYRKSKEKIKGEIPGLDFSGKKTKSEEKSAREESFEKIEGHIAGIEGQIKDLEKDTPERRAEEKKVEDCVKEIGDKVPSLVHIDNFERLSNANILEYLANHNRINAKLYISKYGENAFKEALFKVFNDQVDKIAKECNRTLEKRYGKMSEEGIRDKVKRILQGKINLDVTEVKIQNLIDNKNARSIKEKEQKIFADKRNAETYLPIVVGEKSHMILDGLIKTRPPLEGSGRFTDTEFEVYLKNYVSDEASAMASQIEGLNSDKGQAQVLLREKIESRPWIIGKKDHMVEEQKLKNKIAEINKKVKKLEADLSTQKERDSRHERKLSNLSRLVINAGLSKEASLITQGTTVKEFLDEMERILKENLAKELTPEEKAVIKEYNEVKDELQKAKYALEDAVRY